MTARAAHLIQEALKLSPEERIDMAAELLASVAAYRDMATDEDREAEAHEWVEATARDIADPAP